jgi:phage replication-related protein YjqB (UPF0714/DUF867 family)
MGALYSNETRIEYGNGDQRKIIYQSESIRREIDSSGFKTEMLPNHILVGLNEDQLNIEEHLTLFKGIKLEKLTENGRMCSIYFEYNPKENVMDCLIKHIKDNNLAFLCQPDYIWRISDFMVKEPCFPCCCFRCCDGSII